MRFLERRADHRMQVVAAPLARISQLGFKPVELGYSVAVGAQYLLAEAGTKEVIEASIVARKAREELLYCKGFCHGIQSPTTLNRPPEYGCQGDKYQRLI
jgi:hypothetical protein